MDSQQKENKKHEFSIATLGGGCFWCTEAVFSQVRGIVKVESGYSGGQLKNPTYQQVSSGRTRHAEVVQITFDPEIISFREILDIFFSTHDPTTLNRQGNDIGTQYRSVIFYHNEQQKDTANQIIAELNKSRVFNAPIVTTIEPFSAFYPAEEYHKDYFRRHPNEGYSRFIIAPKLVKLRKGFLEKLVEYLEEK